MAEVPGGAPAGGAPAAGSPAGAAPSGGSPASGGAPAGGAPAGGAPSGGAPASSWRNEIAGDNKDFLGQLERYTDPSAFGKAHQELQRKLSSGELKPAPSPFPAQGTPEEQKAWRESQGVPLAPTEYKITPPEGVVFGETDKPGLDRLTQFAHKQGWSNERLNETLLAYQNELEAVNAEREQMDGEFQRNALTSLKSEWKADYQGNMNAMQAALDLGGPELRNLFLDARTADGRRFGDNPAIVKWVAMMGRELNPESVNLSSSPGAISSDSKRLDELNKLIKDRRSEYYRGPTAQKLQSEYKELLVRQDIRAARKGNAA
jgi:hypothetical protein